MNPSGIVEGPELSAEAEFQPKSSELGEPFPSPAGPNASWLRLAYALEFLIAILAIVTLWSEVGGEGHLDLMPWYIKLVCIGGLAWSCVRFTAALVERQEVWTARTLGWLGCILLFFIAMGLITYYYHLHEEQDDGDDDTAAAAAVYINAAKIDNSGIIF